MSSAPERASGYERGAHEARAGTADQRASAQERYERSGYESYERRDTEGSTALAAWLMILGGLCSFFIGLAIVVRKAYFTSLSGYSATSHVYAYHWNITGWGWASLALGAVVVAAGVCVLLRLPWARWLGVVLAVISGVGTFLFLPFFPLWSIVVIAIDIFIIWALMTAKRRQDV